MPVSTTIPQNWKLPLFWAVVDGSQAGNLTESQPALLIGQAFLGGEATAALKGGSTGNGTIALDAVTPVLAGAQLGVYKVKFSSATAFTVTDPANATVGAGALVSGAASFAAQVKFTLAAGVTAFVNNDEFDITVAALPAGAAQYNVAVAIGSDALGKQQFGEGSMLSRMVTTFLKGNTTQQLWCLPIPKPAAGTKAAGAIAIATPPTGSGVLSLYIAGQPVAITVYGTDSATAVAANLAAAINALNTLPVKAAAASATVTLTCRWHGLTGNDITLVPNYRGLYGGEALPSGLSLGITPMAGGTGTPDFTAAISAIQAKQFYHFGNPYTDTASLKTWDAEVGFGPTGRWAFTRQQYGWVYTYYRDTYANLMNWGLTQNSPVISAMALEPSAPTPVWEYTAGYCAQGAAALLDDPARPLQTLEIPGCLPAPLDQRFSQTQLNNLANTGFAVQGVAPSANPMILRETLQYQLNSYGQADTAFALITVLSNLAELLSRMKAAITSKYPRHKLAPDGTRFGPGQKIVTPKIIKAELVAEARLAEYDGLMSRIDAFIANLIVEIDPDNPNRVNILWAPQLMGQLRDFDVLAQFRLNYPTISLT